MSPIFAENSISNSEGKEMYTLYYMPGACSLATQTVFNELDIPVELINKTTISDFTDINPTGMVPVLKHGNETFCEGAAILLHVLDSKPNHLMPASKEKRKQAIEDIMFANATMHPTYSRLFFGASAIQDEVALQSYFEAITQQLNKLWAIVDARIGNNDYLAGSDISPADILLTVYSSWDQHFPVSIERGANTERMIANVQSRTSYQKALAAEQHQAA